MTPTTLLQTILRSAAFFGRELAEKALTLIYALMDQRTPAWARTVILGALTYLVFPLDACPDFIPVVGLADDLGVVITALLQISNAIRPEHAEHARATCQTIFGT